MAKDKDAAEEGLHLSTEEKILRAAARVFMLRGKAGTSMQDIADEAGINRTLLHYYFRNKDKLFDAIFEDLLQRVFPSIVSVFKSDLSLTDKIELVTEKYVDLLKEKPFLPFFILQEISLNPIRLVNIVNKTGFNRVAVADSLKEQIKGEGVTGLDPRHFVAHFLGMVVFPFVARPLFIRLGFENDQQEYERFLEERKKEIPRFFRLAFAGGHSESGDLKKSV